MSTEIREKIATAANSVPGINVNPYYRQSSKAGDGMVRLDHLTRSENGFGFMVTWQVMVVLPQDLAQAERYLDERIDDIVEAVRQELVVTSATPSQLVVDNGTTIPVVIIEGSRAAD